MPELEIACPKTQLRVPTGIARNVESLVLTWALKLEVKCPHCGEEHEITVREAYLDGVLRAALSKRRRGAAPQESSGPPTPSKSPALTGLFVTGRDAGRSRTGRLTDPARNARTATEAQHLTGFRR
jgi:hypothetical protein